MSTRFFKKRSIALVLIFLLILGFGVWFVKRTPAEDTQRGPGIKESFNQLLEIDYPSPTPDPFADLTIPYLRSRNYVSSLGNLVRSSETSTYTSYLTSYDSDGLKINGLLTQPKSQQPTGGWPAIVFVHGYIQPALYQTTQNYASYVDYLARNGFVVFKIDLRGHGNSEGDPGGGYYSGDYVIDVLNAYAALASTNFVEQSKIGLWGHSMAGNVTFRAFSAKQEIPALVVWAGAGYTYSDLREYRISDNSYRPPPSDLPQQSKRLRLRELHGDFDPNDPFWQQVPGTNYLNDRSGAIQIHHAVDDTVVSIEYSQNLLNVLDATQIVHELYEYPSGGHNLTGGSFTQAMQRTVEFFRKNL